jgi:hypothetical protein
MSKPAKLDAADLLNKHGAGVIVDAITAYWVGRGFDTIDVVREEIPGGGGWQVRSNMVNGFPPGAKPIASVADRVAAETLRKNRARVSA